MSVLVAAVRKGRRRRRAPEFLAAPLKSDSPEEQLAAEAEPLPTESSEAAASDEKSRIKKNLNAFYSEFEAGKEIAILKKKTPGMEQDRVSPLSPGLQQGNPVLIPNGVEKSFKSRRSFSNRQRDVEDILLKHPHKIPIIVERSKTERSLATLDKSKFLVPEELSMSQLTTIIRRRLKLTDTQAFYLMVNHRSMASASSTLSEVYRKEKDADGFLYITYASQEMFG